jgi:type IV secretory pathway VirB2 component (pilin)
VNSAAYPTPTNAIHAAVYWVEGALDGTFASILAVIAIASVGLLLMTGRVDVRRATQVIVGCFIIFGASAIAQGIIRSIGDGDSPAGPEAQAPMRVYTSASTNPVANSTYDLYAGVAVPPRR